MCEQIKNTEHIPPFLYNKQYHTTFYINNNQLSIAEKINQITFIQPIIDLTYFQHNTYHHNIQHQPQNPTLLPPNPTTTNQNQPTTSFPGLTSNSYDIALSSPTKKLLNFTSKCTTPRSCTSFTASTASLKIFKYSRNATPSYSLRHTANDVLYSGKIKYKYGSPRSLNALPNPTNFTTRYAVLRWSRMRASLYILASWKLPPTSHNVACFTTNPVAGCECWWWSQSL